MALNRAAALAVAVAALWSALLAPPLPPRAAAALDAPAMFEAVPPEAEQTGLQQYGDAAQRASKESWLQRVLGTDCYSQAVKELRAECNRLSDEQRSWLAVSFTGCHQRVTRHSPFSCGRARSLKDCVAKMDEKTYGDYLVFLQQVTRRAVGAGAGPMCLFLQNQRFQEVTARLMTDMLSASASANQTLAGVLGGLRAQSEALAQGAARLEGVVALQEETRELAARGAEGVAALIGRAENLSVAMAASLQLSDDIISLQASAVVGLDRLASRADAAAAEAEARWAALARGAEELGEWQRRSESFQARAEGARFWGTELRAASEGLLARTSDMRQLLELLLGAQSRAVSLLERLSSRHLGPRELAFWGAAVAVPVLFVGALDLKLGMLGAVLLGFAAESALGLGGLRGAGALSWGGACAGAWAVRAGMVLGAAAFAGWRLHERGRAQRELVAEVKALRAALEQRDAFEGRPRWEPHHWPPPRPRPGGGGWPLAGGGPPPQPTAAAGGAAAWLGEYAPLLPQPAARSSRRVPAAAPAGDEAAAAAAAAATPMGARTPRQPPQPAALLLPPSRPEAPPSTGRAPAPAAAPAAPRQRRRLRSVAEDEPLSGEEGAPAALLVDAAAAPPPRQRRRSSSVSVESRPAAEARAGLERRRAGRGEGSGAAASEGKAPPERGARFKRRQQQEQQQEQEQQERQQQQERHDDGSDSNGTEPLGTAGGRAAAARGGQPQRKRARRGSSAGLA
ncbi:hypothetical protein Rsub_00249 [Raphidocelis subcapitata]|uniref:Uncharacterized protein n=1 Tax=Raphidocelis subcapitata TaxID=307507 RepID=A0A2V0NJV4_9CHLO|nr:hypothetical protein Rsub_00249 [Raphidocelis subcapitata]|eukprot:GBF87538.1 hypothetical protein Rsub_00249 [Raphidocelis subcapitata]